MSVHPTHAKIDLAALRHNLGVVRRLVGPGVKVMSVVKSNGYGHGVRLVAKEAVANGVDYLAVARVDEGIELRDAGIRAPILVFELPDDSQIESAIEARLDLTVASRHAARRISETAVRIRLNARVHFKIDSGMGRLGFHPVGAAEKIERMAALKNLEIGSVWSHFATADTDEAYAREQLSVYKAVLSELEARNIPVPLRHIANSAAIVRFPDAHFDIVRPGIMQYGMMPSTELDGPAGLRPVMSLVSKVSFVKEVEPGTSISYGRTFVATGKTRIATVPIGYADGYARALSSKAAVLIGGRRFPVVGTVSMDHIMVDVGPVGTVAEGDVVTLIGVDGTECISCRDLADIRGTIPYEVMCGISARVPRKPLRNGEGS